jgi:hypothetical protein
MAKRKGLQRRVLRFMNHLRCARVKICMNLNIAYTPNCWATVRWNRESIAKAPFENGAGWDGQEESCLEEFITLRNA